MQVYALMLCFAGINHYSDAASNDDDVLILKSERPATVDAAGAKTVSMQGYHIHINNKAAPAVAQPQKWSPCSN